MKTKGCCLKSCVVQVYHFTKQHAEPHSSVSSVVDLRTRGRWFDAQPIFFPRIDDSHCNRIHSSLTVVCCFHNGYVGQ